MLDPYVLSPGDVWGKDDLNNLLGKFQRIERETFKLWLTSLPILIEVLHAGTHNMSKEELTRIRQNAVLYVKNESFDEAACILEEHNFCIIAGIPGIGKTILAEMLVLHYSRAGYEVVKVSEDISDAWKLLQPKKVCVFYYDDFLGQTSFSKKLNKNEDQRLLDFIHLVRKSTGVKLILTTREYILKQAYQEYEKLNIEGFRAEKCIVDLAKYTRMNRAKILFNHIYFSDLPSKHRKCLLRDNKYLSIIDHANYSPRIVKQLTNHIRLRDVDPCDYLSLFIDSLNNPLAIWEHAFTNHLSQAARNLLLVLVGMPYETFSSDIEVAYRAYTQVYSNRFPSSVSPQDFRRALKELEGDFLEYQREGTNTIVRYQNPSVRDFVKQYLTTSQVEMIILIEAIAFIEQVKAIWSWKQDRGGQSVFRLACKEDPTRVSDLINRVLTNPPCRITNFSFMGYIQREYRPLSLEEKVALILEIGADCCVPLINVVENVIPQLSDRMRNKLFDRDGLADIVGILAKYAVEVEWMRIFINDAWKALIDDDNVKLSQDLGSICWLAESYTEFLPEDSVESVKTAICSVANSIAKGDWDMDADALREEAETLESLACDIKVDIQNDLEIIHGLADELEEEGKRFDEEIDYTPSSSNKDDNEGLITEDDKIASMFSMLDDIV